MKTVEFFECDGCGKRFNSKEECEKHELECKNVEVIRISIWLYLTPCKDGVQALMDKTHLFKNNVNLNLDEVFYNAVSFYFYIYCLPENEEKAKQKLANHVLSWTDRINSNVNKM